MGNCKEYSWTIDHLLGIPEVHHKHILGFSYQLQPYFGGGGGGGGGSMDTIKHIYIYTIGKLLKRAFIWYQNEAYRM